MLKFITPLVLLVCVGLVGYSKSTKEQLVGEWVENNDRQLVFRFFEDGALAVNDQRLSEAEYAAEWKLIGDSCLLVECSTKYDGYCCATNRIALIGDRLYVTDLATQKTTEHFRLTAMR